MSMKEARIVLPFDRMHPCNHEAHASLKSGLIEAFGGFTSYHGVGGWSDQGKHIVEDVRVYDVAMASTVDNAITVYRLAELAGQLLDQKCVYVRAPQGHVTIVPCGPGITEVAADLARMDDDGAAQDTPLPKRPGGPIDKTDDWERRQDAAKQPLGTKRLPGIGEVWELSNGGRAAVIKNASVLDGGYHCVLLDGGPAATGFGYAFLVNLDGQFGIGSHDPNGHPFDLRRYASRWQ